MLSQQWKVELSVRLTTASAVQIDKVYFEYVGALETMNEMILKRKLKRARPVYSCVQCRSKKLRCDRRMPCEMCTKSGRPNECKLNT